MRDSFADENDQRAPVRTQPVQVSYMDPNMTQPVFGEFYKDKKYQQILGRVSFADENDPRAPPVHKASVIVVYSLQAAQDVSHYSLHKLFTGRLPCFFGSK